MATRTAGHIREAREWLNEAIAIADCHKLPLATEVPMQSLASMALDDNDIPQAKNWYTRLLALPKSSYNTESRVINDSIGLRISLSEKDFRMARSLVHSDLRELASDPMVQSRTYGLALLISVQLANGDLPDESTTRLLESSHLVTRKSARQSFATFVLVSALRRRGKEKHANHLLKEYLDEYRREPSQAPLHILELFESFPTKSARR